MLQTDDEARLVEKAANVARGYTPYENRLCFIGDRVDRDPQFFCLGQD